MVAGLIGQCCQLWMNRFKDWQAWQSGKMEKMMTVEVQDEGR